MFLPVPSITGEPKSEKLSPSWVVGQDDRNFKSCPFIKFSSSDKKKTEGEALSFSLPPPQVFPSSSAYWGPLLDLEVCLFT